MIFTTIRAIIFTQDKKKMERAWPLINCIVFIANCLLSIYMMSITCIYISQMKKIEAWRSCLSKVT